MALVNRTKEPIEVKIVLADGTKDSVNLHRKIERLPAGARIDPNYAKEYEAVITDTSSTKAPSPVKK